MTRKCLLVMFLMFLFLLFINLSKPDTANARRGTITEEECVLLGGEHESGDDGESYCCAVDPDGVKRCTLIEETAKTPAQPQPKSKFDLLKELPTKGGTTQKGTQPTKPMTK